ncbi:MAG: hypothetical protein M1834_004232 [Cirrosporium novae-zelandiae]|nr:MAG: hypothetical protein M1834_004232 [Cirrosporium novae-zelandiae]
MSSKSLSTLPLEVLNNIMQHLHYLTQPELLKTAFIDIPGSCLCSYTKKRYLHTIEHLTEYSRIVKTISICDNIFLSQLEPNRAPNWDKELLGGLSETIQRLLKLENFKFSPKNLKNAAANNWLPDLWTALSSLKSLAIMDIIIPHTLPENIYFTSLHTLRLYIRPGSLPRTLPLMPQLTHLTLNFDRGVHSIHQNRVHGFISSQTTPKLSNLHIQDNEFVLEMFDQISFVKPEVISFCNCGAISTTLISLLSVNLEILTLKFCFLTSDSTEIISLPRLRQLNILRCDGNDDQFWLQFLDCPTLYSLTFLSILKRPAVQLALALFLERSKQTLEVFSLGNKSKSHNDENENILITDLFISILGLTNIRFLVLRDRSMLTLRMLAKLVQSTKLSGLALTLDGKNHDPKDLWPNFYNLKAMFSPDLQYLWLHTGWINIESDDADQLISDWEAASQTCQQTPTLCQLSIEGQAYMVGTCMSVHGPRLRPVFLGQVPISSYHRKINAKIWLNNVR